MKKKKKLKRKIKRLETRLNYLCPKFYDLEKKFEKFEKSDKQLLNCSYEELKAAKEEYERAQRSVGNTLGEFNKRLMILEARTQVDYTKFVDTSKGPDSNIKEEK